MSWCHPVQQQGVNIAEQVYEHTCAEDVPICQPATGTHIWEALDNK